MGHKRSPSADNMDLHEQWKQLETKEQWKLYNTTVLKMICTGSVIRILFTAYNGELAASFAMQIAALFTMLAPVIIHALSFVQSRGRNYVIFLIFQVYQFLNVLHAVSKYRDQFGPILLFSTVFCVTLEVSWFYNRWVTLLVVNKHFLVWLFAWKDIIKAETPWLTLLTFPTIGYIIFMNMMVWGSHSFFTTMSFERFIAQRSAEQRWEFIESIVQSVRTGIIVLNPSLQVQLANTTVRELLAIKESVEVLPRMRELVYDEENQKSDRTLIQDVERLALDSSEASTDLGLTPIGGHILDWKATKVHLSHEHLLILTCSDVADYIRLQHTAKDENAAKTVLLRTVTHELRTPLNAVINVATDLLEKDDISAEVKNQLSILRTSGQLMLFVTNDLLDFSQLMAGKLSLHFESFEIRKLVAEVTSLLHFQAQKKDLHLVVSVCGRTPQTVYSDPNRFAQVMLNLCSNALKCGLCRFTQQGAIMLKIEWVPPSQLHISVRDTGIGIRQEDINALFKPFSRLTDSVTLNKQGCGLGLSISNQLVQAMGGSAIQVQSVVGEGSLFFFTLPVLEPPNSQTPMVQMSEIQNVLIVDDNTFNTEVIKSMLTKMKVTCDVAHSGPEAIQMMLGTKYDAVLMDLDMPGMSGFECLSRLKELTGKPLPPVFAHSGDNSGEVVEACKLAGFDGFIEKPAPRAKLQALLLRSRPKSKS